MSLRGQRAPWALSGFDRGPVAGDLALEHLTLVLQRSPGQQKAFEQFLRQQQDPGSLNYHHWLTSEELGTMFGASPHDIEAISEWLRSSGLRVDNVSNSRMMIDFSGAAAAVGAAFGTEIHTYEVAGEQRIATPNDPRIPTALSAVIRSVTGLYTLNNHAFHGAHRSEGSTQPGASFCSGSNCSHVVFPGDFTTIYDLQPAYNQGIDGTGETVAIIGRARVWNPDIENFQSLSGLSQKDPVVTIPPAGVDPGAANGTTNPPGDQVEATLDVMRSGSIAPGATINLIVSKSTGGQDGVAIASEYAIDTNPVPAQIMNISFGLCEQDAGSSGVQFWDNLFSQAAGEGISVFVASGDAGAAGCDAYFQTPPQTQILSPNYICSSSYGTCVGGTEFADTANPSTYWSSTNGAGFESAISYIPEGAWNEPMSGSKTQAAATGGGVSSVIAKPSWQTGTGVPISPNGRFTPDIAFTSSGHDGYFGCLAGAGGSCVVSGGSFSYEIFFGTSAAAPDMAGIAALLNQKVGTPQGQINQRLYQLAATPANAVFHDVTVASSGVSGCAITTPSMCNNSTPSPTGLTGGLQGYLVGAGFDEATGLGSIDVFNLLNNWISGSATATAVVSSKNPANQGVSVTFTATVTTGGANAPTGSVTFKDSSTTLGTGTLNGSSVATFTTSSLGGGPHSITAVYGGDTNNAPSTSAVLSQMIVANTTTALSSSANPAASGASVTFTAIITGATPTGTVTFFNNGTQIGTGSLTNGRAMLTTTALVNVATYTITANYGGDANNQPSSSSPLQQAINPSTFTISVSPSTQTVTSGGSANFNVTVTPQGIYTSTVSFAATVTPSGTTVSFNPATIVPNGTATPTVLTVSGATSGPLHATLTLPSTGQSVGSVVAENNGARGLSGKTAAALWMSFGIGAVILAGGRKKNGKSIARNVLRVLCLTLLVGAAALSMPGCGGGGSSSHPTQSYQIQVTATASASGNSGAVTATANATLTAQ